MKIIVKDSLDICNQLQHCIIRFLFKSKRNAMLSMLESHNYTENKNIGKFIFNLCSDELEKLKKLKFILSTINGADIKYDCNISHTIYPDICVYTINLHFLEFESEKIFWDFLYNLSGLTKELWDVHTVRQLNFVNNTLK